MTKLHNVPPAEFPKEVGGALSDAAIFTVVDQDRCSAADAPQVVVCGEEIGGTNALMPVVRELVALEVGVTALLAGNGLRMFLSRAHEYGLQLEPKDEWPDEANRPAAVLITPSDDGSVEEYLLRCYGGVPQYVVMEDYHESSRRPIQYAQELGIRLPRVCVIDDEATRLIHRRFPGITVPTIRTGLPTLDMFHNYDVIGSRTRIKEDLGIPDKALVALWLPRLGHTALASEAAAALTEVGENNNGIVFAIRPHPSDYVGNAVYDQMFGGLQTVDTSKYHADTLSVAADVVIAQRSATLLRAVVCGQLSISLDRFVAPGFTLHLVDSGASLGVTPVELPAAIEELLDGTSERCQRLREGMRSYRVDGKAASRVADVVMEAIISSD